MQHEEYLYKVEDYNKTLLQTKNHIKNLIAQAKKDYIKEHSVFNIGDKVDIPVSDEVYVVEEIGIDAIKEESNPTGIYYKLKVIYSSGRFTYMTASQTWLIKDIEINGEKQAQLKDN